MFVKVKITGTQSLALAKSHNLTGLPVRRCAFPTACPSWLSTSTVSWSKGRAQRLGGAQARAGVRPMGGSGELSTRTKMNMVILR